MDALLASRHSGAANRVRRLPVQRRGQRGDRLTGVGRLRGVVLDQGLVELAGQAGGARTRADEAGAGTGQLRRNLLLQDRFLVLDFLNLRRQTLVDGALNDVSVLTWEIYFSPPANRNVQAVALHVLVKTGRNGANSLKLLNGLNCLKALNGSNSVDRIRSLVAHAALPS